MKIVILVNVVSFFCSGESCYFGVSGKSDSGEFGDFGEYSEFGQYCDIGNSCEYSDYGDFGESDRFWEPAAFGETGDSDDACCWWIW